MPKQKTVYVCRDCGAQSPKWVGKCPLCSEWNTYEEEIITVGKKSNSSVITPSSQKPQLLKTFETSDYSRLKTDIKEFDRVLGGGIVKGSVILLGGEPGIGKSTLLLQASTKIQKKVLYVSGEENAEQIKSRSDRLNLTNDYLYFLSETIVENIISQSNNLKPELIIIDSVQTLRVDYIESAAGSVTQVRESAARLLDYAKQHNIPIILVGHITKGGNLAGPKTLEHIVDTVLQFEGDNNFNFRILRSIKNRFGSTHEIGIFEMQHKGLQEVSNPSGILLNKYSEQYSGITIGAATEGVRTFLVEIQALVSSAVYGTPQRSATGFDVKRLNMLLAVLEKRIGFKLSSKDVFLNLAGGIKVKDTSIDLAVLSSILSSDIDKPIMIGTAFVGEVGLSGEIRPAGRIEQRILEADKLGFKRIFVPKQNIKLDSKISITVIEVEKIEQVFKQLFTA